MDYKRVRITQKNPNPLFKQWLREVIKEAERKKKKISKTYQKALESLERYPLTLYSGHDCHILEGFGPKICDLLEEKLQKYFVELNDNELRDLCFKDKIARIRERESEELHELVTNVEAAHLGDESTMMTFSRSRRAELSRIDENDNDDEDGVKKREAIALSEEECPQQMPKIVLTAEKENKIDSQNAQLEASGDSEDSLDRLVRKYDPKAADERKRAKKKPPPVDFNSPVPTARANKRLIKFKSFNNATSSVAGPSYTSSPISKFLDVETSPSIRKRASLQDEEEDQFDRLVGGYNDRENEVLPSPIVPAKRKTAKAKTNQITAMPTATLLPVAPPSTAITEEAEEKFDYISIQDIDPSEFDIVLLIDIGESKATSKDIQAKLREFNVMSDVRKLHVGDFLWIAKHKVDRSRELVLPYIVERKRLDDLSSSIKDGRFHEQKFRLKHCGLENVIYLIENYMKAGKVQCSLPFTTLLQAAANTQIQNKFMVKFTESSDHSGIYLAVVTSFIDNIFRNKKPLVYNLLEFSKFNQASVKQRKLTVRETFIKQLLTLKGLSVDIALEITKFFPTPSHLYEKYLTLSKSEGEALLSQLTIGDLKRKIPSTVSKVIYQFYMKK